MFSFLRFLTLHYRYLHQKNQYSNQIKKIRHNIVSNVVPIVVAGTELYSQKVPCLKDLSHTLTACSPLVANSPYG